MPDHLDIDFPTPPFVSVRRTIVESTRLYLSAFSFLAAVTLAVAVPGKLAVQAVCAAFEVPAEGALAFVIGDLTDLLFLALIVPAAIYGLVAKLRTGKCAGLGQSLGWGWERWGRMLWARFKVEITVTLWSLLLIVPGVVAMIKLVFTDPIAAIEARPGSEILQQSRTLTEGRRWRIFLTLLPALPLSIAHMYAAFRTLQVSRFAMALVDSLFTVADQWMLVAVLLMYLGVVEPPKPRPRRR